MNTRFKLRNVAVFVVAGLAALFIAVGCKGNDGDESGGGNDDTSVLTSVSISGSSEIEADKTGTLTATAVYTGDIASQIIYTWEIISGKDYAEINGYNTKSSVTIAGKNTTNKSKNVTVKVTASYNGAEKADTHTITVGAASAVENKTWIWNPSNAETVEAVSSDTVSTDSENNNTEVTLINGAAIVASSATVTDSEGTEYANALFFDGKGSTTSKAVKFTVDGACKIYVVARSSGSSERNLKLSDGSTELTTFSVVQSSATPSPQSYEYTGGSGTLYLYSAGSGIHVYLIKAVYGSSSATGVSRVTISGGSSVAVNSSVTLTATANATPKGAYTWEIAEGSGYVTLGSSTMNTVEVTGKAAGTAKITVTVDGVTSEPCTVTVYAASDNDADLVVTPGAKVTTNGWADLANNGAGMTYPDTSNVIYIGDDGYKVGNSDVTSYTSSTTKRKAFTNAIASGSVSSSTVNETAAIIVLGGRVDLSDGKVSDANHAYFDEFDASTHKRKHEDIVYQIGSNKAIIGVNGAQVAFGGLQIYANKCDRGNIIIQNIDFWDAHGSTEEDTAYKSSSKASADSLVLESNGTNKDSNGHYTYTHVPKNIWIDHCKFSDGTCTDLIRNYNHDGSLDMKAGQFVTVSYCEFTNHDKVTLLAPNDDYVDPEQRQITFHHNYYHGAIQRMPRSRGCQVHIYNNYYNDIGTKDNGGFSLGPGIGSQFIVENNYFGKHTNKILKYFDTSEGGSSASTFSRLYENGNNVTFSSNNMATDGDKASVVTDHLVSYKPWTINYVYEPKANAELPGLIPQAAGTDKAGYTKKVVVNGVPF